MKTRAKFIYSVFLCLALAIIGWSYREMTLEIWRRALGFSWMHHIILIISSIGLITVVYGTIKSLESRNFKFLEVRLIKINLNFTALQFKSLRIPFILLFYFSLPLLSFFEEFIFRHGLGYSPTETLTTALWRSLVFGLAHLIGGIPLRSGLVLSIAGLYLSAFYINFGLMEATFVHMYYNLIFFSYALIVWATTKKNPLG